MKTLYSNAFKAQIMQLRARLDSGMSRLGWKVGLNVPEIQHNLGLSHALVGWLDGDRLFASGAVVPIAQEGRAHVEPEVCLRICSPVTSLSNRAEAVAAVDAIAPALELVDYARPITGLDDVVRCSMFHSATVLGTWHPACDDLAIAPQVSLKVGPLEAEPARADLVPSDLADLVLFVAKMLGEVGEQLYPGDHILSGSFTAKAIPLRAGQTAEATLGHLGSVRCTATVQPGNDPHDWPG